MMPFNKLIKCDSCSNEFIVVGNTEGISMSTSPDGAVAKNVVVGSVITTEGTKQDIRFDADCPECGKTNHSNLA